MGRNQKQRLVDKTIQPPDKPVDATKLLAEVRVISTMRFGHGNKRRHADRYTHSKKAAGG